MKKSKTSLAHQDKKSSMKENVTNDIPKSTPCVENLSKHAAITIASKNYISLAITLAESYKLHHPENDFIIILVDQSENMTPKAFDCGAELVEISDLPIPDLGQFIYRYSIMELNTAVKPFALSHLFSTRNYETILYLDPDIFIYRPLLEVYEALSKTSIVLTPHMRNPFFDDAFPNETAILQSGTYNLGFIGLKRGKSSKQLLDWWMSKLYRDCIVDIPNGLFVDQKWIDLIPGFFPDHQIIYNPAYNVAYWNLHERKLTLLDSVWYADETPLAFFHFSGYSPFAPNKLSKHQNRHELEDSPELRKLVNEYRDALITNHYVQTTEWPYAFQTLSNGVELPLRIVNAIMQWAARNQVPMPDPLTQPNNFCKTLMSKGISIHYPQGVLLYEFILSSRPDVRDAYPNALLDSNDAGFRGWLNHSAKFEGYVGGLIPFENKNEIYDYVEDIFSRLRNANPPRTDVFDAFQNMWSDRNKFFEFVNWVKTYGVKELGLTTEHAARLVTAIPGIFKILNIYFLRQDLQNSYPSLHEPIEIHRFADKLRRDRYIIDINLEEISIFSEFALHERELIEKMRFMYSHFGRTTSAAVNLYSIDERRVQQRVNINSSAILNWLSSEDFFSPLDHFYSRYPNKAPTLDEYEKFSILGLPPAKNFHFVESIRECLVSPNSEDIKINLAGYFNVPTGMGEAARSIQSSLQQNGLSIASFSIPNPRAWSDQIPNTPFLFGWPKSRSNISITIANADSISLLNTVLPHDYWAKKNIAYWLWETEELPIKFKSAESGFDEIWTSSEYAARAIRKTTELPVKVLPLALDLGAIDNAKSNRANFKLPATGTLFGFNFDPNSILERKNLRGLIEAFKLAFNENDDCYLILKANGKTQGTYEYEKIRAEATSEKIIFFESTLSRQDSFDFMKSLDVYVSLHRSEGFGLTCAEAMALGKPVIASNYSGNLDFMDVSNSILITTNIIETNRPYGPYPKGTKWGDPDLVEAAQAMRKMLNHSARITLGKIASTSIRKSLAPSRIRILTRDLLESTLQQRQT
jgi:glycosyltransferase involved in cell wall biosynthesis